MLYRVTIPNRYPAGSPGHTDPTARQGHYVHAASPEAAASAVCARRAREVGRWAAESDRYEVQPWSA